MNHYKVFCTSKQLITMVTIFHVGTEEPATTANAVTVPVNHLSDLIIYNGGCLNGQPQVLLIGDSIIRFVKRSGGHYLLYCLELSILYNTFLPSLIFTPLSTHRSTLELMM